MPKPQYGWAHQQERRRWAPKVATGQVQCWRCNELIERDAPWDLGHADGSTTVYVGPEHMGCNRGAAGRLNMQRRLGREFTAPSDW
jgi:hypothetical protein